MTPRVSTPAQGGDEEKAEGHDVRVGYLEVRNARDDDLAESAAPRAVHAHGGEVCAGVEEGHPTEERCR